MKRFAALALLSASMLSGCAAGSMRAPVTGYIYSETKGPEAVSGPIASSKTGRACATSILGLVGTGDASIQKAAQNGGIKTVNVVDADVKAILGVWAEYCTVVYGE